MFRSPKETSELLDFIVDHLQGLNNKIDVIVGLDSRGFLFGPWLANRLNAGFVPIRKEGKLPPPAFKVGYTKEYGTDFFELSQSSIQKGQNVVVLDDLIATGGSAKAAGELVKLAGGNTIQYVFFIELTFLNGKKLLDAPTFSVFKYDD